MAEETTRRSGVPSDSIEYRDKMIADRDRWITGLQEETRLLYVALKRVEWIEGGAGEPRHCHVCVGFENDGHYDDCYLKRALEAHEREDAKEEA